MYKITVTKDADPGLAGIPAVITGVTDDGVELVLRFDEGSGLFAHPKNVVLLKNK